MAITIISLSPSSGEVDVPVHTTLEVVFSTALDLSTLDQGTIFMGGSDRDIISGPYQPMRYPGTAAFDVLSDPGYNSHVKGSVELQYVDTAGSWLGTSFVDATGTALYYTKAIFTPDIPLYPQHDYTVYLIGTGTSTSHVYGIRTRTVYDAIADGGNGGNGNIYPWGGYSGTTTGTFTVDIVASGVCGDARYQWRKDAEIISGTFRTHSFKQLLKEGVRVSFGLDGTFSSGDSFTFLVKPPDEYLADIQTATWRTGDAGSAIISTSTSLYSTAAPVPLSLTGANFGLSHTYPDMDMCEISSTTNLFTFYFNKTLDTAVDTQGIFIYVAAANGDTCIRDDTTFHPASAVTSGSALLVYMT